MHRQLNLELNWAVGTLIPGEKQILSIEGEILVSSTKTTKAGIAQATYEADSTLSNLAFETWMRSVEDSLTCVSEKTSVLTTGFVKPF